RPEPTRPPRALAPETLGDPRRHRTAVAPLEETRDLPSVPRRGPIPFEVDPAVRRFGDRLPEGGRGQVVGAREELLEAQVRPDRVTVRQFHRNRPERGQ